jgi:hypothetical protein
MADPLPQTQVVDSQLKQEVLRMWSDLPISARATLFQLLSRLLPTEDDMIDSLRLMQEYPNNNLRWLASYGTSNNNPYFDSIVDAGQRIREAERDLNPEPDDSEMINDHS